MNNKLWDKIGICTSGLCLIHCLATPLLLLFFPGLKLTFGTHSMAHEIFAVVIIISIIFAVYPTCRQHGHKDIIGLAVSGSILIITALFLGHLPLIWSDGLTITGSILLIWAHIKNMKVRHGKCETNSSCSNHH